MGGWGDGNWAGMVTGRRRVGLAAGAILVGLALAIMVAPAYQRSHSPSAVSGTILGPDAVHLLRTDPICFSPAVPGGFQIPPEDLARILRQVEPQGRDMTASVCLHVLAVHGLEATFRHERLTSGREILRLFTDDASGKAYFGSPAMVCTRYGIRPAIHGASGASQEWHYDQTLGCLAGLGIPLSLPIRIGGAEYCLREALRDSLASFELRQGELEWTVVAYASYLPPYRSWVNKFGEPCSFDDLTEALLGRDFTKGSCSGCHIVEAMIKLLRVNREVAEVLSPEVSARLAARLGEVVRVVLSRQEADGSWGPD